jgi:hypothetical protein
MNKKKIGDKRGSNPNSLENLKPGSQPKYGERKRPLQLTVTPTAISGAQQVALELGCSTLSELVERIGRGAFVLSPSPKT